MPENKAGCGDIRPVQLPTVLLANSENTPPRAEVPNKIGINSVTPSSFIENADPGIGWCMPKEGGAIINGRYYTKHALERMAPNTPQVKAELEARAQERGIPKFIKDANNQTIINPDWKKAITQRGIPSYSSRACY